MSQSLVRWSPSTGLGYALLCIPWAGAGAAPFRSWAPYMSARVELWATRLPGRESRLAEAPIAEMGAMVEMLVEELEELELRSLALFGHCTGALIAFELARELRRRDAVKVHSLIVASQPAPTTAPQSRRDGPLDVREGLRRVGATSDAILDNDELFELIRPAVEADAMLADGYVHRKDAMLAADIHVLSGEADPLTERALHGWRRETTGHFTRTSLPGGHMFVGEAWGYLGQVVARLTVPKP